MCGTEKFDGRDAGAKSNIGDLDIWTRFALLHRNRMSIGGLDHLAAVQQSPGVGVERLLLRRNSSILE